MNAESPAEKGLAIQVKNLSKKYNLYDFERDRIKEALHPFKKQYHRDFWALSNVSFDVQKGTTIGILGKNGSGKSSLLQVLASIIQPTQGQVFIDGSVSALLELGAGFDPDFTGRRNAIFVGMLFGLSENEMHSRMPEIEAFARIGDFIDQPVKVYSTGMFVRLAFATAINVNSDILLIDEALSVGDARFQHRCFERLRDIQQAGKTILFVTHDQEVVVKHSNSALLFDNGRLVAQGASDVVADHYQNILYSDVSANAPPQTVVFSNLDIDQQQTETPVDIQQHTTLDRFLTEHPKKDMCPYRPNYNEYEMQYGGEQAEIVDFIFFANGITNPKSFSCGDHIEICVKALIKDSDIVANFGFALRNVDGIYVYGSNSTMNSKAIHRIDAGDYVVFQLAIKCILQKGNYFMDVGVYKIAEGDETRLNVRRQLIQFHVGDTPLFDGMVDLYAPVN